MVPPSLHMALLSFHMFEQGLHMVPVSFHMIVLVLHMVLLSFHMFVLVLHMVLLSLHRFVLVLNMVPLSFHMFVLVLNMVPLSFHRFVLVLNMALPSDKLKVDMMVEVYRKVYNSKLWCIWGSNADRVDLVYHKAYMFPCKGFLKGHIDYILLLYTLVRFLRKKYRWNCFIFESYDILPKVGGGAYVVSTYG